MIVAEGGRDGGVEAGGALVAFVDAALNLGEPHACTAARDALIARIGVEASVDAAAVAAMFQFNTRAADAAGIALEPATQDARSLLGQQFGFAARANGNAP